MGRGKISISPSIVDYVIVAVLFRRHQSPSASYVSKKNDAIGADGYSRRAVLPWYLIGFSLSPRNMSGSSFRRPDWGRAYDNGVVIFNYEWTAASS